MAVRLGVPPEGEKIRAMVEDRLAQARQENGAKVTVQWRGQPKHLDVISMPLPMLYFNPDTHRVRAQRTLDPERNRSLEEEPWSALAQDYLHQLLRCKPADPDHVDPDYIVLRAELDEGQREPGIITPHGILVDGNTRCAALRDLGKEYISVAVLPPDTSWNDVSAVELALQLRRDRRRDYSYLNRLIAIEEQLSAGRRSDDIARSFNIRPATLSQDRWVYQLIQDAIERSRTSGGVALRLIDFEDHQEKLRELHRDFTKLAKTDPDAAEQLKESRLAMVVLNYAKTAVRLAKADFYTEYLEKRLPDGLRPTSPKPVVTSIPGLTEVSVPDATPAVKTTRALTDVLLQAKAAAQAGAKLSAAQVVEADSIIKTARRSFDTAVKLAGVQSQGGAAPERLTDAADYVNQCAAEFAGARAVRALDDEAFDDALITLRASLVRLARLAGRAFDSPGEGVAWLLSAVKEHE